MSFISGYRGLVIGVAIGLVVAGIPVLVLYGQVASLNSQNSGLARNLADAQNEIANLTRNLADAKNEIANHTRTIAGLESSVGNLSAELAILRSVVNFTHVTVVTGTNLTIPKNNGYGWGVGGPDMNMDAPGYIAVIYQGGVVNSNSTSIQAHLGIQFINKSLTWDVERKPQIVLISYLVPMGGNVEFINDGNPTVWVNFQILYLT